jgi:hypothetical protein
MEQRQAHLTKPYAAWAGISLAATSQGLHAHELIQRYNLPVPFWLYLYGCAATLVVTFALIGWFVAMPVDLSGSRLRATASSSRGSHVPSWLLAFLRSAAVACLGLTIAAGLLGTTNPDRNISLILFWVVFLLGFMYATAVVGNLYELINPWRVLADRVAGTKHSSGPARLAYPEWLGYWPALLFYIALVWIELFVLPKPRVLAVTLLVYSTITFGGVWLFGANAWFRFGDVFSVLFRVVSALAPIQYVSRPGAKTPEVQWRWPLTGPLMEKPDRMSLVVFVLFMLSSTTFDGIHGSIFWMGLYWNRLLTALQPLWGTDLIAAQVTLERWYVVYQRLGLVLSPFFYLAIYLGVMALVKLATKTAIPLRTLALEFGYSVVPIAFVYNLTHYFTLLILDLPKLPYLVSDPFGFGWNLLRLEPLSSEPPVLNVAAIWHVEVALIVIGHVVSVYLAHGIALRLFVRRRDTIIGQVPMLLLMVTYTLIGLWVISLPFALT